MGKQMANIKTALKGLVQAIPKLSKEDYDNFFAVILDEGARNIIKDIRDGKYAKGLPPTGPLKRLMDGISKDTAQEIIDACVLVSDKEYININDVQDIETNQGEQEQAEQEQVEQEQAEQEQVEQEQVEQEQAKPEQVEQEQVEQEQAEQEQVEQEQAKLEENARKKLVRLEKLANGETHLDVRIITPSDVKKEISKAASIAKEKIEARKQAIVDKAQEYKDEIASGIGDEISQIRKEIASKTEEKEKLERSLREEEEKLKELESQLRTAQEELNTIETEQTGKIDTSRDEIVERGKNSKALIKKEKREGFFKRFLSDVIEKFSNYKERSDEERATLMSSEEGIEKGEGIFEAFGDSVLKARKGQKEEIRKIKEEREKQIGELKKKIAECKSTIAKARDAVYDKEEDVSKLQTTVEDKKEKVQDMMRGMDTLGEEMQALEDKKAYVEDMTTGKALVKSTLRDIKKKLSRFFGREKDMGMDR